MLMFDNPEIQEGASWNVTVIAGAELDNEAIFADPLEITVPVTITSRMMDLGADKDALDAEKYLQEEFSLGYEPFEPRMGDWVEADLDLEDGGFLAHQLEIGYFVPPPDVPDTLLAIKMINEFPAKVLEEGMNEIINRATVTFV